MNNDVFNPDAWYAEQVCKRAFVAAGTAFFEVTGEVSGTTRERVTDALYSAAVGHTDRVSPEWDARRRIALADRAGELAMYFNALQGTANPSNLTVEDLDQGQPGPVGTNSRLITLQQQSISGEEFLRRALSIFQERGTSQLGPENYATALHYYRLKYKDGSRSETSPPQIPQETIAAICRGFSRVAEKDAPNFVELTNIFCTIRDLPPKVFPKDFTPIILRHALEQLPTFNRLANTTLLQALPSLDLTDQVSRALMLLELALEQRPSCERVADLQLGLRCIAAATKADNAAAIDGATSVLFERRNDVEQAISSFDDMTCVAELLKILCDHGFNNPQLYEEAGKIAHNIAEAAIKKYRSELTNLKDTTNAGVAAQYELTHKRLVDTIVCRWGEIKKRAPLP